MIGWPPSSPQLEVLLALITSFASDRRPCLMREGPSREDRKAHGRSREDGRKRSRRARDGKLPDLGLMDGWSYEVFLTSRSIPHGWYAAQPNWRGPKQRPPGGKNGLAPHGCSVENLPAMRHAPGPPFLSPISIPLKLSRANVLVKPAVAIQGDPFLFPFSLLCLFSSWPVVRFPSPALTVCAASPSLQSTRCPLLPPFVSPRTTDSLVHFFLLE